jgi:hypothetical protein
MTEFETLAQSGVFVLDIRLSATSPAPVWRRASFEKALGSFYYRHCPALGNKNRFNGGPIELANPKLGLDILRRCAEDYPLVALMCGCADWWQCHREEAANLALRERVCDAVIHLDRDDPRISFLAGDTDGGIWEGPYAPPEDIRELAKPVDLVSVLRRWEEEDA